MIKRPNTGCKFIGDNAETEKIASGIHILIEDLLGGHVLNGAANAGCAGVDFDPKALSVRLCRILASPKSNTLTSPSSRTMMFSGLMSRWTIAALCALVSADAT